MEKIRVNRLPSLTYRYLKTNDTPVSFRKETERTEVVFSDMTYVKNGGNMPATVKGASPEALETALAGDVYTIDIPQGEKVSLDITVRTEEKKPDFASAFLFHVEEGASLSVRWIWEGPEAEGQLVSQTYYRLDKDAELTMTILSRNMKGATLIDQRHMDLDDHAKAKFTSALLGGENIVVHSYAHLSGKKAGVKEYAVYAAGGTQKLDLFYHVDHVGEESTSHIDVKGALAEKSKKVFRGTIDFKRGASGSVGDEGDYAIQLDPETRNISLPLLLCTEDNVVGNHASSAGQLDENIVYYLMTRGFDREEARRIVVESLIRPLIDEMDESMREDVLSAVREKLGFKQN